MISKKFKKQDAPILIVLGQSNAHGHGTLLNKNEQVIVPYKNVFGLKQVDNQSYDITNVKWSNFVTYGMNLGETQDCTCCLISEFARLWQRDINKGSQLPDLYVIQISIGAQGIDKDERNGLNMWYPYREPVIKYGNLQEVNISLYPLATHILKLAMEDLKKSGKNPVILGLHWNQWETEVDSGKDVLNRAKENYRNLLDGFYQALSCKCKTYLYRPISQVYHNEEGRHYISAIFDELENTESNIQIIDIKNSPIWDENLPNKGIFQEDLVHYNNFAQKWFAMYQYKQVFGNNIIVLGDSITEDGKYISFLNAYMRLYRPEENINFLNIGVRSENATGLTEKVHPFPRPSILNRIDKVLEALDTDLAIVCYGMNDGIYHPLLQDNFDKYKESMNALINKIHSKGIKVCLMTPPPFDPVSFCGGLNDKYAEDFSYLNAYCDYDDVLKKYSDWLKEEFKNKVYAIVDIHSAVYSDIDANRKLNANYISSDGIHPNMHGHCVMALTILKELFHVNLSEFEQIIEKNHEQLFHSIYKKDSIIHAYLKETIGHDHPDKDDFLPEEEACQCIQTLNKEIEEYIAHHKELYKREGQWNNFRTEQFYFKGYEVIIAMPHKKTENNPWIYRTEFFGAFPYVDIAMLNMGYCIAYIKLTNLYGCPFAVNKMEQFRVMMVNKYNLYEKPILFGFSRGGLYALFYAAEYPEDRKSVV